MEKKLNAIFEINEVYAEIINEFSNEDAKFKILKIISKAVDSDFAILLEIGEVGNFNEVTSSYITKNRLKEIEQIIGINLLEYRFQIDQETAKSQPQIKVYDHISDLFEKIPRDVGSILSNEINLKSIISVPLLNNEKYLGEVVFFMSNSKNDMGFLEVFCSQALTLALTLIQYSSQIAKKPKSRTKELKMSLAKSALAEEKINEYYLELVNSREEIEKRSQEQVHLLNGLRVLLNAKNTEEIFSSVLHILNSLFYFDDAYILERNVNGEIVSLLATNTKFEKSPWMSERILGRALSGETIAVYDTSLLPDWKKQTESSLKYARSALFIPLITISTSAVLVCVHSELGFFSRADVELAKQFSVIALQGINHNELLSKINQEKQSLELEVNKRTSELIDLAKFPSENPFPVMRSTTEGKLLFSNPGSEWLLSNWNCSVGEKLPEFMVQAIKSEGGFWESKSLEATVGDRIFNFSLNSTEEMNYVNIYGRDITAEKISEKIKAEFIANISHELRTPLAAIVGYSEILLEGSPGKLSEVQQEFISIIQTSSNYLHQIVNNLLDVSLLESGRFTLNMSQVNIEEIFTHVVTQLEPIALQKNINLLIDPSSQFPTIKLDRDRFTQVIINLINNGIKFNNPGGKVILKSELQGDDQIMLKIEDNGIGISPTDLPKLFDRFFRGKNVGHENVEGTGLGLYISKAIVESHLGEILAESEQGKGTKFTIVLPI